MEYKKFLTETNPFLDDGLRSARLDPRLTPVVVRQIPSWYRVPTHAKRILTKTGKIAFSKPAIVMTAIATATAATIPELSPYLQEIYPLMQAHMVVMGSTVAPALMFIWMYWRKSVTAAQKAKIKSLKEDIMRLQELRSNRTAKNVNAITNRDIMRAEKHLEKELTLAFKEAYAHSLPTHNLKNYLRTVQQ